MPQPMSLARAAKLAGVKRSELQNRLRESGIDIFEGKIAVGDLLSLYPDLDLERDPVFERIRTIRQDTRPKREYSDGWIPEPEVLLARLKEMQSVLVRTKARLNRSEITFETVTSRLSELRGKVDPDWRAELDDLIDWLTGYRSKKEIGSDLEAEIFARDMFYKVLAAKVRLTPSGHEYQVEGRESLLEAALRSGLHLDFGCSSGNCGKCKCRVLSGKVLLVREHDYYLTEDEIQQGYVLACSTTAVTDLVIEAHEAKSPGDLPRQKIRAAVESIEHLGMDGALLRVKTPRTKMLRFMSGQSVRLINEEGVDGHFHIASCACDGRNLEFLVRHADDPFTLSVHEKTILGQVLNIDGPFGDFVLKEESMAPILFITAGDGYGPVMSMMEQAVSIDHTPRLQLYLLDEPAWGGRFQNRLRSWEDALDNFELTRLPADTDISSLRDKLHRNIPDLAAYDIYLCGPGSFVTSLKRILTMDMHSDNCRVLITD